MKMTSPQYRMLSRIYALGIIRFPQDIIQTSPTFRRLVKKKCIVKLKDYSNAYSHKTCMYDVTKVGRAAISDGG